MSRELLPDELLTGECRLELRTFRRSLALILRVRSGLWGLSRESRHLPRAGSRLPRELLTRKLLAGELRNKLRIADLHSSLWWDQGVKLLSGLLTRLLGERLIPWQDLIARPLEHRRVHLLLLLPLLGAS